MAEPKQTIRLLMTADTIGGVWTYALELVKALQPYGVQVHLATMGSLPAAEQLQEAEKLSNLQLHTSTYKLEWMDNPWEDVAAAGEWLLRLEHKLKPDIVHLNNYCHGQLPWQAPVLMVGHSCVLSWWKAVKGEEAPVTYAHYAAQVAHGLQTANVVVAPTKAYLQQLKHYYGPFVQEAVIANGRDVRAFSPAEKENSILSAGRLWDEAKNIAACALAASQLSWPVYIAGDLRHPGGGQEQPYTNFNVLGHLNHAQIAAAMAKAAIYVMPAKYEPFGLSILEAALSGCALVLGDIPSLRENWQDAALFVDPAKPEEIRQKLEFLILNPGERQRLGALAREKGKGFTPELQAVAYLQLYRDLVESCNLKPANSAVTEQSIVTE